MKITFEIHTRKTNQNEKDQSNGIRIRRKWAWHHLALGRRYFFCLLCIYHEIFGYGEGNSYTNDSSPLVLCKMASFFFLDAVAHWEVESDKKRWFRRTENQANTHTISTTQRVNKRSPENATQTKTIYMANKTEWNDKTSYIKFSVMYK